MDSNRGDTLSESIWFLQGQLWALYLGLLFLFGWLFYHFVIDRQTPPDHRCFTPNQSERCLQGWLYYKGEMKQLGSYQMLEGYPPRCQCACHAWEEAPDGP